MATRTIRAEKIAALTDQQALSIVESIGAELADDTTPEGSAEQADALQALMAQEGQPVDVRAAAASSTDSAGAAARELLGLMAQVPEMQSSLDEWLDNPPKQEAAAVPLILAAPVVLTGCIVLLQVVGHTRFSRERDGSWSVTHDPAKRTPFDQTLREAIGTLAGIMKALVPGGGGLSLPTKEGHVAPPTKG